jgi:putative DNA primase/helicase
MEVRPVEDAIRVISGGPGEQVEASFEVTFFPNESAQSAVNKTLTLKELAAKIRATEAASKAELPWLKLARFGYKRSGKNCLRTNENVQSISGVEGDYDGGIVSFDDAVARVQRADIAAILYTSASHTEERPRWRIACLFSRLLPPQDRERMLDRVNGALGGILSNESWTLSQAYYFGNVTGRPPIRVEIVEGRSVDLAVDLDTSARGKPKRAPEKKRTKPQANGDHRIQLEELSEWVIELVKEGKSEGRKVKQRGPQFLKVIKYLHNAEYSEGQVLELFDRYPDGVGGKYSDRLEQEVGRVWEKLDAPTQSGLPIIDINPGKHEENACAGLEALRGAPFYQRGGRLVSVVSVKGKSWDGKQVVLPAIVDVDKALFAGKMSDAVFWRAWNKDGDPVRVAAPGAIVEMAMALPDAWPFPVLRGVIGTPTLRPDGSVLDAAGYDEMTGFVLHNPPGLPCLPAQPTRGDAEAALQLLDGVLDEVPFAVDEKKGETKANNASRSTALSGLMTTVLRAALDVAPMHALSAPLPGTGKSYLVDMCSMLGYGDRAAVLSQSSKEDETEKRLIGAALSGQPIIPLDNCSKALSGDFLCQVTERPVMQLRPLGGSGLVKVENTFTVFANGNNLEIVEDQVRRTIMCRMDANRENPERRQFTRSPLDEIQQNRGKYITAVLTIVRAYICQGKPGLKHYPSYDGWSHLARSPLVWLGRKDPVVNDLQTRNPTRTARAEVFTAWDELLGTGSYLAANLINRQCERDAQETDAEYEARQKLETAFRNALLFVAKEQKGDGDGVSPERLGHWLRKAEGVVVGGLKLTADRGNPKRVYWRLQTV